jgi:hypothetical protein
MYFDKLRDDDQSKLDSLDSVMLDAKAIYLKAISELAEFEKTLRTTYDIPAEYLILRTREKQVGDRYTPPAEVVPVIVKGGKNKR